MNPIIEIKDLSKRFKGIQIFEEANLKVEAGERLALIGPNGSGKSVLFKLILGFLKPNAGEVKIAKEYQSLRGSFPKEFGAIIDRPAFRPDTTGFENLWELASIRRLIGKDEVRAAMSKVGLDPENQAEVRFYSLGMKQKLALAQAFMEGQKVLLLDEPFNGLDKKSAANVRALLLDLSSQGRTLVFTSHNEIDVESLATRKVEIQNRKIEEVK
jgi:ABC-2 type transport system ATP-binding protein